MFDITQLRSLLSQYKQDLLNLITATSGTIAKKVISHGSDKFLALLLNMLFHVTAGHVPISKKKFPRLAKSKRSGYLHRYLYCTYFLAINKGLYLTILRHILAIAIAIVSSLQNPYLLLTFLQSIKANLEGCNTISKKNSRHSECYGFLLQLHCIVYIAIENYSRINCNKNLTLTTFVFDAFVHG